jgi:F0F1-type ATP synthase assembly protein I
MSGNSKNHAAAGAASNHDVPDVNTSSNMFVGLTASMAWQLAVVIIIGLFGGYKLDAHFHSAPLWTLIGLGLAMVAMVLVVRRTLQQLNEYMNKQTKEQK